MAEERNAQHAHAQTGKASPHGSPPDNTAVRVALWRALHVLADAPPYVFTDTVGQQLAAPEEGWRERPDMSAFTAPFRASILARARFVEDALEQWTSKHAAKTSGQYVVLGAGLDTLAQRRTDLASRLTIFEIDKPSTQAWKSKRLVDLGFSIPSHLRLVPVDFEAGEDWRNALQSAGFDAKKPAFIASTGVSMYLTREAVAATLRQVASMAEGTTLVMSFLVPMEMTDAALRPGIERAAAGAKANGTPWLSFFVPEEMLALARESGFKSARHQSSQGLAELYFSGRSDGLRPPNPSEELLVAEV